MSATPRSLVLALLLACTSPMGPAAAHEFSGRPPGAAVIYAEAVDWFGHSGRVAFKDLVWCVVLDVHSFRWHDPLEDVTKVVSGFVQLPMICLVADRWDDGPLLRHEIAHIWVDGHPEDVYGDDGFALRFLP